MKNIRNINCYNSLRAFELLETLSRDLNMQMTKILGNYKLMTMNYDHFIELMKECEEIFKKWEKEYTMFK
jgi:dynein heavy chain 1